MFELGIKANATKQCWPPGLCPGAESRNPKAARVGLQDRDSEAVLVDKWAGAPGKTMLKGNGARALTLR